MVSIRLNIYKDLLVLNILIINHYAGTDELGMEYRHFYLGQELVRIGHNVTIVAASYSHLRRQQPIVNGWYKYEVNCGLKYCFIKSSSYRKNGIKRFLNMFTFICNLFLLSNKISKEVTPDVVINSSTYPMDIWPAKFIAKKTKAKLVFELHDIWPMSPKEIGGMSHWHPFIQICQIAENCVYNSVDGVVSLLPEVHEYVSDRGICLTKLLICPNGFKSFESQRELPVTLRTEISTYIASAKLENKIIVVYTGSMGLANALDNLLDCAKISSMHQFCFVLVGSGIESKRLNARIGNENIGSVAVFDPIKKSEVSELLGLCDIGYLGAPSHPLYKYDVSQNKFIDYTLANLPIVNATEAGNNLIDDTGCGFTVEPDNPWALSKALIEYASLSLRERTEMGRRGRAYTESNLNYQALANDLSSFLNDL